MSVKSGFTPTGFKSEFSSCSRVMDCDFGRRTCYYSETDPATMNACRCYKRNRPRSLYDELNIQKIDKIFSLMETPEEIKHPIEDLTERQALFKRKEIEKAKTMKDNEILQEAVIKWVAMSGSRKTINSALEIEDYKGAFRHFCKMINESGSGGRMINFMKIGPNIEIRVVDGREFNPTEKELFNLYRSIWELKNVINLFNLIKNQKRNFKS